MSCWEQRRDFIFPIPMKFPLESCNGGGGTGSLGIEKSGYGGFGASAYVLHRWIFFTYVSEIKHFSQIRHVFPTPFVELVCYNILDTFSGQPFFLKQ